MASTVDHDGHVNMHYNIDVSVDVSPKMLNLIS